MNALLLAVLVAGPASAEPRPAGTSVRYEGRLLLDDRNKELMKDAEELDALDCSRFAGTYVTLIDGSVEVLGTGDYQMSFRTTRLFGRSMTAPRGEHKGKDVNVPTDEPDCTTPRTCPHQHLLGEDRRGKNCRDERPTPPAPEHGSDKASSGAFIDDLLAGGPEADRLRLILGLAIHQRRAPKEKDLKKLLAAGRDPQAAAHVDPCFAETLYRFHNALQGGLDGVAQLEAGCPQVERSRKRK